MLLKRAHFTRTATLVAAASCFATVMATAPAVAQSRPAKVGPVTGLTATVTKPGAAYRIDSTWNVVAQAAGYRVKLVNAAGTTLAGDSVSVPSWTTTTTAPAGTTVRVVVTAFNGTRKSKPASVTRVLPDLTAPTGAYDVTYDTAVSTVATVTETALSDDVTASAAITRSIDWGEQPDTDSWQSWSTGAVLQHEYPTTLGVRYQPRVRLQDAAGNTAVLLLRGVVIGDESAPSGTFTASPVNPWAKLNAVTLTQTAIEDNFSPSGSIERLVDWKDGTPAVIWSSGTVLRHLYTVGGTFTPTVTLADEAFNQATVEADAVTVRVDAAKPTVRLLLPTAPRSVRSWLRLHGRASDGAGTGVRYVEFRAVQKRGASWYAFKPALGTWVRAGSSRAAAFSLAGVRKVAPTAAGDATARLPHLRVGVLVVRLAAVDRVGNRSATASYRQQLVRY